MPSDNPFAEPDDSDRTVIRPAMRPNPGGAPRPPVPAAAPLPSGPVPELAQVGATPLAAAAAPLLALLSRLRNTVSQPDSGELRERAVAEVRRFEQQARADGIPVEQLRPAHYALCASLDDVVLATPWGSEGAWAARSLTSTFHQEVGGGDRFFDVLAHVRQNPGSSLAVLELMFLCLSLGFQGRYRLSPRGPAELDRVREETYGVIVRQRGRSEPELSPNWVGVAAPYRALRAEVPLWVGGSIALALLAGVFAWASMGLAGRSDTVFEAMIAAPPARMPAITRAALVQPLPPPPPAAEPGAVDRLRTFLRPEIDQGLVTVIGTDAVPVVRIRNRGLFGSGSATVQPAFAGLLARIGSALQAERGAVSVIGYTDNQPIRTVQFPSNFQLSAARAKAASAIIGRTIGDAGRLSTQGRADADPVAANATAEGRDENRRIEVVLHREA